MQRSCRISGVSHEPQQSYMLSELTNRIGVTDEQIFAGKLAHDSVESGPQRACSAARECSHSGGQLHELSMLLQVQFPTSCSPDHEVKPKASNSEALASRLTAA